MRYSLPKNKLGNSGKTSIIYFLVQGLYWMTFCIAIGYSSVYLLANNLSNVKIGFILAISNIIAALLQTVISALLDRKTNISLQGFIKLLILVVIIATVVMLTTRSNLIILSICVIIILAIIISIHPLVNSLCLLLNKQGIQINFGLARGIGSVAYAVASILLGRLITIYDPSIIPIYYLLSLCGLFIFVNALHTKKDKREKTSTPIHIDSKKSTSISPITSSIGFIKKYRRFLIFIVGSTFIFFAHNLINCFTIQLVRNIGGNNFQMGFAIFLASIIELPVMAYFNSIKQKFDAASLLKLSAIIFTLKHILTLFSSTIGMFYVAQCFQFGGFALFIPAVVFYAEKCMEASDMIKGQSIITTMITLSGIFASFAGGLMLDNIGVFGMLTVGVIASVIGAIIIWSSLVSVRHNQC